MTRQQATRHMTELQALLHQQEDLLRRLVQRPVQDFLEAEMTETLGGRQGRTHRPELAHFLPSELSTHDSRDLPQRRREPPGWD